MSSYLPFLLFILAGMMNACYILPTKYTVNISLERAWFYYSIIGLLIVPGIILFKFSRGTISNYHLVDTKLWIFILSSGALYGVGQLCFTSAIKLINPNLAFTINSSLSIYIGSLFIIFYHKMLLTSTGIATVTAIILISLGNFLFYLANNKIIRRNNPRGNANYRKGCWLAILAGLMNGYQIIYFILVIDFFNGPFNRNNYWIWPPFLAAAGLIMAIGYYQKIKSEPENTNSNFLHSKIKDWILVGLMGLLFSGALYVYSFATGMLNFLKQIIAWPSFMLMIMLFTHCLFYILEIEQQYKTHKPMEYAGFILAVSAFLILAVNSV